MLRDRFVAVLLSVVFLASCSKKKTNEITLKSLQDKKIAVTDIQAERELKSLLEVALVNEIVQNGRFEIVDRESVMLALSDYPAENDRQKLGMKVGADYVLSLIVEEAVIKDRDGLDVVHEADSLLQEEWKEKKPVVAKKYVKVKSTEGTFKIKFQFLDVKTGETPLISFGEAHEIINSRDKPVPRKLQFMETLSNIAVGDFFSKIPK